MRIRSLDIHGFKSFPDKTRLVFGSGIGCVVGPNGCGKSNLVDAIKWCVGEQSAKSLRGDDMADVIFGGSTDRSAVGFAEVTLTFSAEGGDPFPGVYARLVEMAVTRRLFRDGRSEYLLNGERVRRKDVIDLFLDTGVGANLYSFIEQGRIGEIIHASPEKRRLLVDEAAGISRYKARRDETQHELEAAAAQLDRVADVSEEMAGRLRILEGQVARAARFRRLRTAIRQDETLLGLVKYADLAYERKEARVRAMASQQDAATAERELVRKTAEVESRRAVVEQVEGEANAARDVLAAVDAELLASERERDALLRRVEDLDRELVRARHEVGEVEIAGGRAQQEVAEAESERLRAEAQVVTADETVVVRRAAHAALRILRDQRRSEALEADAIAARSEATWAAERVRIEEFERRVAAIPAERERLAALGLAARKELEVLLERRKKLRREADLRRAELDRAQAAVVTAQDTAGVARGEADQDRARLAEVELEVGSVRRATEESERAAAALLAAAERAGVEAVTRAERDATVALAAAEAASARAVAAARDEASEASTSAETRLRQWLEAMQVAATSAERARDARDRDALAAAEVEDARAAKALDEVVRRDIAAAVQQVATVHAAFVAKASAGLEAAAEGERVASADVAAAERERGQAFLAHEAAVARRDALAAAVGVDEAADRGTAAVRDALGSQTIADVLDVAPADEAWVSAALGDRLLAPVVANVAQLQTAASIATSKGRATVVLGAPRSLEHLLDAAIVDDLDAAFRHHTDTGGAALVRGTGALIERGGTVRLGPPSGDVLARRRALAPAGVDVEAASARKAAAEEAARVAAAHAVATKQAAEQARVALRAAERTATDSERAIRTSAELEGRQRIDVDRVARRVAREKRVAAARAEADVASTRTREQLAKAREEGARISTAARQQVDAVVAAARAAAAERERATRTEIADQVAKVRLEARQREGDARTRLSAARSSGAVAIEALGARVDELRAQATRTGRQAADLEAAVQAARATQFTAEVAMARAAGDLQGSEAAEERLRARIVELVHAAESHDRLAEQTLADATASRAALELVAAERDGARASASERRRAALAAEAEDEAAAALVAGAGVAFAGCVAAATAAVVRVDTAGRVAADLASRLERTAERARTIEHDGSREAELRSLRDGALEVIRARRVVDAQAHDAAKQAVTAARRAVREAEALVATATLRRDETTREAAQQVAKAAEFQREIEALCARLDERYQVSLPGLLDRVDAQGRVLIAGDDTGPIDVAGERIEPVGGLIVTPAMLDDVDLVRERVAAIEDARAMLRDLGEVNLGAFDEYREVAVRHAELSAQRADIEASVATIREAIARLNTICRERFREAFDRVNSNFQAVYPRLVGGGSARLALTDEEDLLEAGVDIFVQPPGKRLQNLALLSGGEKAMAAISLLIALFQVRPSPFCLLDEVDAPLDEANGRRFNDMLREMSGTTQFIVISHNRKTMEAADVLYGITMPTPGVSRLVAVRLGA